MIKLRVKYGHDPDPVGGAFYWPSSPAKRKELLSVKRNHPAAYESVYQCRPGQREGSIFLEEDFSYYVSPKRLELGVSEPEVQAFLQRFHSIVIAWDTAFESTADSDHTVGIAAGLMPCDKYHRGEDSVTFGPCEPHLDVYLLDLIRDKLDWGGLVSSFRQFNRKWAPLVNLVEKRGTGISLYQSMPAVGITVEGVQSNESKRARAVAGNEAGSVQGWFRQHRVLIPKEVSWALRYKTELKDFTGEDDADDDQVDASVHLVNYAIQQGGSFALISSDWTPERVDEIIKDQEEFQESRVAFMGRVEMLNFIQLAPSMSENPFYGTCSMCVSNVGGYCKVQRRLVVSLDSCGQFTEAMVPAV
jgi:predicted phage terminase large subunit-like protein